MNNKVYLVESSFGQYDGTYSRIEGIFTDPAKAEELKLKVVAEIDSYRDLEEPLPSMEGVWTKEESLAWKEWSDKDDLVNDFNHCIVLEYTLDERAK